MLKRIFIALNPDQKTKRRLSKAQKNWPELPCKWVPEENLHLTLIFLGNRGEQELEKINNVIQELSQKMNSIKINLDKISYGPKKTNPPRLVWIQGKQNEQFSKFKKNLEKELIKEINFQPDKKNIPHITLGRIQKTEWRKLEIDQRPNINLNFPIEFSINSIDVMESILKRSGAEYTILKSFNL